MDENNTNGYYQPQGTPEQTPQPEQQAQGYYQNPQEQPQGYYQNPQEQQAQGYYQNSQEQQAQGYYQNAQEQQPQGYYQNPQQGQPQGYYQQPQNGTGGSSGMAIASMVLGIISIVLCCIWYLCIPCGVVAIVLSMVYKNKNQNQGNNGMAVAGLVCGIIGVVICVGILIVAAVTYQSAVDAIYSNYY